MRIRFCILAVLAALSVGVTAWAHGAVYARREAVTAERQVLEGDPARAEGVTLEVRTTLDRHLFWETEITAGAETVSDTAYTFSYRERLPESLRQPDGIYLDIWGNFGPTDRDDEVEDQAGMEKPFNDVASRCPAGTTDYTETVHLRDYYETYPLFLQDSIVDLLPAAESYSFVIEEGAEWPEQQLQELMRTYFPIPVPEDALLTISIGKDAKGNVQSCGSAGFEQLPDLTTFSVVREGGVYFLLSGSQGETPLDTSLFPLGYGVYFLPVELESAGEDYGKDTYVVRLGDPVRVCPVDPAAAAQVSLWGGEEGELFLFSRQEGTLTLTVLDGTGAVLADFPVLEGAETGPDRVWIREDYLVVKAGDRFRVVETADQTFRPDLEGSFRQLQEAGLDFTYGEPTMDYDGERLALAGQIGWSCASFLALYGGDGLEYLGTYTLSQDRENSCWMEETDPLTVRLP